MTLDRNGWTMDVGISLSDVHTWYFDDGRDLREIETSIAGTGDSFVIRSGRPVGDWSRVIVKVPGTQNCDGTEDVLSDWMNVVKGASGAVFGVLSAFGEALVSIATSAAGRTGRGYDDRFLPGLYPRTAAAAKRV